MKQEEIDEECMLKVEGSKKGKNLFLLPHSTRKNDVGDSRDCIITHQGFPDGSLKWWPQPCQLPQEQMHRKGYHCPIHRNLHGWKGSPGLVDGFSS